VRFPVLTLIAMICFAAGAAHAETINVSDNHGGRIVVYDARWAGLATRDVNVRIVGPCQSACTVLLGHTGCWNGDLVQVCGLQKR